MAAQSRLFRVCHRCFCCAEGTWRTSEERLCPPETPVWLPLSFRARHCLASWSDTRRRAGAGTRRALPLIAELGRHRFRHCGAERRRRSRGGGKNGLKSRSALRLSWVRFWNIQNKLSCVFFLFSFLLSFDSCDAADEHHRSGGELSSSTQMHHQNLLTLTKKKTWGKKRNAPKRTECAAQICFEVLNCCSLDSKDSRNPTPSSLFAA